MLPRVLSILLPLFVYTALGLTVWGVYRQRKKVDWWVLGLAGAAFIVSLAARPNEHLLFFDEDIYIQMASNLSHAPVAQLTVFGGPTDIQVSTYYKEPAGFPVMLSLAFLFTGTREIVAFVVARLLYALAVAAVYLLGMELLKARWQAVIAAIAFAATPACFAFSVSTGTDLPAALFAVLGVWGIVSGEAALAVGGLAMTAQIRLEMIILVILIAFADRIALKWKAILAAMIIPEVIHIGWVFSIAPMLSAVEHVERPFAWTFLLKNLRVNTRYLLDPRTFGILITVLFFVAIIYSTLKSAVIDRRYRRVLLFWVALLFGVYLVFYAGSFDINPRYSIQLTVPIILFAVSLTTRPIVLAALGLSAVLPSMRTWPLPTYVQALGFDHRIAVDFARRVGPHDLVIAGEPEIFLNQGKHALNVVYGTEHPELLRNTLGQFQKVYYYSGVRADEQGAEQWEADRKVKSMFELHLLDARDFGGLQLTMYELLNSIHREGS